MITAKQIKQHMADPTESFHPEIETAINYIEENFLITINPNSKFDIWVVMGLLMGMKDEEEQPQITNLWQLYGYTLTREFDMTNLTPESFHSEYQFLKTFITDNEGAEGCQNLRNAMQLAIEDGAEILPEFFDYISDWETAQKLAQRRDWV